MSYTFNKNLIEQVKAGSAVVLYDPAIHSIDMLHALSQQAWPNKPLPETSQLTYLITVGGKKGWFGITKEQVEENELYCTHKIIPLSNFVQPEQSERDVMADLDERLKRLEDILLRDNELCKAEPEIVNPVRWRADFGKDYFFLTPGIKILPKTELNSYGDNNNYNCGNYFQTTQQAKEMAVLTQFTLNNPELVKQLMDKKE